MKRFLIILSACLLALPLWAVEPDEVLDDPVLEERARAISAKVRCVVCQNEAIDSSHAGVARDLRILVRERLVAGDSDQEVYDFLVARYGDFVLFQPPWKPSTYALWLAPGLIMLLGGAGVVWSLARRPRTVRPEDTALSDEEEAALNALVDRPDKGAQP